jgi:hypothetical protein
MNFSKCLENPQKSSHWGIPLGKLPQKPESNVSFSDYGIVVAKFKFERLSGVGVWLANHSKVRRRGTLKSDHFLSEN